MVEAAVSVVLHKLADVIVKEAQFLGGVGEKVRRMQTVLKRIQCCLEDADSKRKEQKMVQNWLNELRDVAYNIEDATDTFLLEVEGYRKKNPSFLQKLQKLCNKPQEMYLLHKLGTELDNIQNKIEGIYKSRIDFGIKELEDKSKEEEEVIMPHRRTLYSDLNENDVVGLQADKKNILNQMPSEKTPWRVIITIIGPGGLGKTTLAHMVYKSAMKDFEYHIMLPISKQFSRKELFIKMLRQNKDFTLKEQDIKDLIKELRDFISTKRYLILLDDVWGVDLWDQLKDVFPKVNNGSCILVTSRFTNVVESPDFKMVLYKLNTLDHEESRDLLLKKALPYEKRGEKCSNDLLGLADKLSKKCKGLPLALIVLGGILLSKGMSNSVWAKVLQTMDWHLDGKGCIDVLAMSYQDMPYYLKPCFLYLASFPEDYQISAKCLIRMWVAEGFISCQGRATMEEMADKYLEQLFQRSIIEVSSRSINGSIKYFKLHDLVRELAMQEAKQQNIVTVFSEESDVNKPLIEIRRASVQSYSTESVRYIGPNTRSFLCFSGRLNMSLCKCTNFKLLKVLVIVGVSFHKDDDFKGLIHLKYLGIRSCDHFPSSGYVFRHLRTLETLDMQETRPIGCYFKNLWTISTLKYVRCDFDSKYLKLSDTIPGPNSTAYITNLHTLKWVDLSSALGRNLSLLNNLHKLGVCPIDPSCCESMTNLLQKLPSLISLGFMGRYLLEDIIYPKSLPNYQNLQSLYLYGPLSVVNLEANLFPPHLIKLRLVYSNLLQNPMLELGKLKHLKKLYLDKLFSSFYKGDFFCPAGFPVLQYLKVGDVSPEITIRGYSSDDGYTFEGLMVAKGVMPNLTNLEIYKYEKYQLPAELQHVTVNYWEGSNFDDLFYTTRVGRW